MKVLQIGPKSVHVATFVQAIAKQVDSQALISEEKCDFEGIDEEYILSFRGANPFSIGKNYRKMKKIIQKINPDIIHIHQVNRMAFIGTRIANKMRIPAITTAWGSDVLLVPKKNAFYKWLVRSTLQNSVVVTGDSNHMISEMNGLVEGMSKYACIQYGIDPVTPAAKEKIIYSNRFLNSLYRISKVVDYFAEFLESYSDWQLVIASIGEEEMAIKDKVEALGIGDNVTFVGWQENRQNRSWYAKSSIYVSIPDSDGTSVSVLEAISANCIPVLSDIPVSKEWIENGRNGVVESEARNPFKEALELNWQEANEFNATQIKEKAIRESSISKFLEIYSIHGKK